MDAGTGLTVLGSAIGAAKLVEKVLGPTAEYVGDGLRSWAEKRVQNTARIFEKAADKLGSSIENPGTVPPKVLKEILDEGSYCDDEFSAEYFGGVLASARSGVSRDDRAASYLKLVADLSSYQIRFHFVAYRMWREQFQGSGLRPNFGEDLDKMWAFIPAKELVAAMDFQHDEPITDILIHCISGLERLELLQTSHWGSKDHICAENTRRGWKAVETEGFCVGPTSHGIDLWLWAVGAGKVPRASFLDVGITLPKLPDAGIGTGIVKLVNG